MNRPVRRPSTAASSSGIKPPISDEAVKERTGGLAVSASKAIAASAADAFAAWIDPRRRAHWLSGVKISVRSATAPKSVRLVCEDDATEIEVQIVAKGRARCAIAVDHTRLADAQMVAERRHCWKEMLRALKHYLEDAA